jgi:hypothetical protein
MPVAFVKAEKTAEDGQIKEVELVIEKNLPSDYRAFLLKYGGGVPEPNHLPGVTDVGISLFFSAEDLLVQKDAYRNRVPDGLLPIADSEGGNLVCVSLNPRDFGSIYFWDHELEAEEGEEPTYDNLSKVASGFSEFWDSLQRLDVKLDEGQVTKVWVDPNFKWE